MEQLKSRIEAVLFTTGKALQTEEIAEILETNSESIEEAMLELIMDFLKLQNQFLDNLQDP